MLVVIVVGTSLCKTNFFFRLDLFLNSTIAYDNNSYTDIAC